MALDIDASRRGLLSFEGAATNAADSDSVGDGRFRRSSRSRRRSGRGSVTCTYSMFSRPRESGRSRAAIVTRHPDACRLKACRDTRVFQRRFLAASRQIRWWVLGVDFIHWELVPLHWPASATRQWWDNMAAILTLEYGLRRYLITAVPAGTVSKRNGYSYPMPFCIVEANQHAQRPLDFDDS